MKFLDVRFDSYECTLETKQLPCGWLEILHANGNERGKPIHPCPDEEAVRLYVICQLGGEILREYEAEDT